MARSHDRIPARRKGARASSAAGGEFELLAAVRNAIGRRGRGVTVGIGDDAAVVRISSASKAASSLVLTTDTMVEGVHFRRSWLTAPQLGVRAWRAAVSDISAMGARPRWALLSLELPSGRVRMPDADVVRLIRAVGAHARQSGAALVGGNVSGGPACAVTVTIVGEISAKPVLRSGAKPGDSVFVTGALGGSAAARRDLMRRTRPAGSRDFASAYRKPPLRIEFAAQAAERRLVSAMIDVSDGLLQDLGHVAEESGVAIRLDAGAIPIHPAVARSAHGAKRPTAASVRAQNRRLELALTGGEDYELAFTAPSARMAAIRKLAAAHRVPVTCIGVVARGKIEVTDLAGAAFATNHGFDHLREGRSAR